MADLLMIDAKLPERAEPTRWYFDSPEEFHAAVNAARASGIEYTIPDPDYVSDSAEFRRWLRHD